VRTCSLSCSWCRRWESSPGIRFFWGSVVAAAPPAAIDAIFVRYACHIRDFCYWEIPQDRRPLPAGNNGSPCWPERGSLYSSVNREFVELLTRLAQVCQSGISSSFSLVSLKSGSLPVKLIHLVGLYHINIYITFRSQQSSWLRTSAILFNSKSAYEIIAKYST